MVEYINPINIEDTEVKGLLPTGLKIQDVVYQGFVVRGMTGVEEDLLSNTRMDELERLNRVISNCVVGFYPVRFVEGALESESPIEEDADGNDRILNEREFTFDGEPITDRDAIRKIVWAMASVDRLVLLLAIRRASLGDEFMFKTKCPECGYEFDAKVDLSELEVKESKVPGEMQFEIDVAGHKVKWHVLTARDEDWLAKIKKKMGPNAELTMGLLARIDELDGYTVDRRKVAIPKRALASWPLKVRNSLRKAFQDHEGDVDTTIEHECPSCRFEWNEQLNIGRSEFFFPME